MNHIISKDVLKLFICIQITCSSGMKLTMWKKVWGGKKKKAFSSTDCAVERALFTTHSAFSHKIRIYSKGSIMTTITPGGPFLLKKWTFLSALKSKCLHYANLLFRMIAHLLICKIHKHSRAQDNLVRYLSTSGFST